MIFLLNWNILLKKGVEIAINKGKLKNCRLSIILKVSNISQIELSEMTGISDTQISQYINDKRIMSLSNAWIVAHVLRCSIEDLYESDLK